MGDILEFLELLQEVRGSMNPGRLKLQSGSLTFKNTKTGKLDTFQASDVDKTQWIYRARGYCFKVIFKSGTTQRYDGFRESDYEKMSEYLQKNYQTKLEKKDPSLKGWNWGIPKFNGNTLDFKVEGNTAFEIPLTNISHSATTKNEVTIEFHQNDDAPVSLMEMRFHIPSDVTGDLDPVAEFYKNVMAKADVIQATGDAITIFSEIHCLTPRGRYDIKIFPTFLQLHGKTFDYKIPYATILRLFLLPHRDTRQVFFVVSLDPPIKQGQTRYHFLILLFNKETETTLELSLSDKDIEKYEGKLQPEMSGPEYEVVSRVMKVLLNKKITIPGSFVGHSGTQSIACSYKAATGYLYPLERGFIFVHKPPLHVRFDEISFVNFARSAGSTRYFDFDIETKTGTAYNFVGIEKDEYGKLFDFVSQKKLRVKNVDKTDSKGGPSYADDMEDSDDDDRVHNAYMEKMKAEGKDRGDMDMEEDDDESDESFKPEGSASEPDDEYDSNLESTSDSDEEGGEKKERKKKSNASDDSDAANSGDDDDAGDEDEEDGEKKEKKKEKEKKKSESKPRKSKKKDVDPDKPKRAQSAYFLWMGENRNKIKEEFPGISVTELSKKLGERWKDVEDKSKYEAMAAKEKESYELAMSDYKKSHKDLPKSSPSPKKSKSSKKSTSTAESNAGSGGAYKSKEFVESDEASESDSDGKPLKRPKKGSSSEPEELPEDEPILSTPEASGDESD